MLHHVIENQAYRGLFAKTAVLSVHPPPIPCANMHLDWTVAHSVCTLKHNIFINGCSGNNVLPFHVILFLEN